ncbi:hypothetical protein [Bartonella ancashensis]
MHKNKSDTELDSRIMRLISTFSDEQKKDFIFYFQDVSDLKEEELFLYLADLFFLKDQ